MPTIISAKVKSIPAQTKGRRKGRLGLGGVNARHGQIKLLALICALLWTTAPTLLSAASEKSKAQQLKCDIGPVNKTYGKTQWLVYSCDDSRTLVIVAAPGNPATPFYFMFSPHENGYQLSGEGTGQKDTTDAAFNELHRLSERDITTLIEQTKPK